MLSPKQQIFVAGILKGLTATKAATKAGYSSKTAAAAGSRLLTNPEISAAVSKRTEQVAMSADEVLTALAGIARGSPKDSDRVAALALLGKNHKLFTEKHEVDASLGGVMLLPPESD